MTIHIDELLIEQEQSLERVEALAECVCIVCAFSGTELEPIYYCDVCYSPLCPDHLIGNREATLCRDRTECLQRRREDGAEL